MIFDRKGNRKYLNRVERGKFLRHVKEDRDLLRRAFCLTLYYTGCRISEALHLKGSSVDVSQRSVVFRTLKRRGNAHFRAVPVPDELVILLRKFVSEPEDSLWLYSRTTAWRILKIRMKQAGIFGTMACPKGLRHGFAVACISHGIPLTMVQKWMGHARLETTAIYLDAIGEEERELAEKLWVST